MHVTGCRELPIEDSKEWGMSKPLGGSMPIRAFDPPAHVNTHNTWKPSKTNKGRELPEEAVGIIGYVPETTSALLRAR